MGYNKRREIAEKEGKKLTGRELFMTDKTLDQSDLKFLDDGLVLLQLISFIINIVCDRTNKTILQIAFRRCGESGRKFISKFG